MEVALIERQHLARPIELALPLGAGEGSGEYGDDLLQRPHTIAPDPVAFRHAAQVLRRESKLLRQRLGVFCHGFIIVRGGGVGGLGDDRGEEAATANVPDRVEFRVQLQQPRSESECVR